jgi:hypothetical protein
MPASENILHNPGLILGFFALFPAALWVVTLVGWMITDEIGMLEGIFGISAVLALLFITAQVKEPFFGMMAVLALMVAGILYPVIRSAMSSRAHLQIDMDLMWAAYRLLDARRTNVGAKVQLAKLCYKRGLTASAIALLRDAVDSAPELLKDEKKVLQLWESEQARMGPTPSFLQCPKCLSPNTINSRYCRHCGVAILLHLAGRSWIQNTILLNAFYIWAITVAALVLVPYALHALPPVYAAIAIILILVMSTLLFYRILRRRPV